MKEKTVVLIRHGETAWNAEERWQGHVDIPLNETGRSQATRVGRELEVLSLQCILSSDLLRARQTAELIVGSREIPIQFAEELREVHVGDAEGLNREEMIRRFGEQSLTSWGSIEHRDLDFAFPGGETKSSALRRASDFLTQFLQSCEEERVGVISHGMLVRTFLHNLFPGIEEPIMMMNCDYFTLSFDAESRTWTAPEELQQLAGAAARLS